MAYTIEALDITTTKPEKVIETSSTKKKIAPTAFSWWMAESDQDLVTQVLSTT